MKEMSAATGPLHPIEKDLLKALALRQSASPAELSELAHLDIDQVRRGVEWLKFKDMVSVSESTRVEVSLGEAGKKAADSGLPERRLVEAVKHGSSTLADIIAKGSLAKEEANAAVAAAKRNGWIRFGAGGLISAESTSQSLEESLLLKLHSGGTEVSRLDDNEMKGLELLSRRPDYIIRKEFRNAQVSLTAAGRQAYAKMPEDIQERSLTPSMITTGSWRTVNLAPLDVTAGAPPVFPGRRHPLVDVIEEIKEIFVGLGFEEIDGPMTQTGFWNFDALYIPQDHSAREMQDTFYVSGQSQTIEAAKDQVDKVSREHTSGWGTEWKIDEAKRVVLRTHTTPVTLRHLARVRAVSARFFSVGRVFRNEKPSYKHLVEFHQVEGVATGPKLSLRDLMGLQKEFYARMGIKKVKFWPTFFPYTEPSLQSMVYNETLDKWVELFGMGIFRPEVTKPLGIKNPVLAWGGGIERIAMLRYGLDDVRDLYGSKLAWLRSVAKCPS